MKKLVLAAAVAIAALSSIPGHTAPAGCVATPGFTGSEDGADSTCTYVAGGAGKYVIATPNHWSVTVTRGSTIVFSDAGDSAGTNQGQFDLPSAAGDTVTVVQGNDCAAAPVCGEGGIVAAGGA